MKTSKTLWLDVDGVLLDYTTPFLKYAGLSKTITYDTLYDYNLGKLFAGGRDECDRKMLGFAQSALFTTLPAIASKYDLQALRNSGWTIRAITHLPVPPQGRLNRMTNLTMRFGNVFDEVIFTDDNQDKFDFIWKRMTDELDIVPYRDDRINVVVEDSPSFLQRANTFAHPALTVYGIEHPYNTVVVNDLDNIELRDSFDDVTQELLLQDMHDTYHAS